MSRSEKSILNETLVGISALPDTFVWRNNTGQAWQGERLEVRVGDYVKVEPNMVILREARPVRFGLEGSADILGATHGKPLAVEVKTVDGRQSRQQHTFQGAWEKVGGIYILCRSKQEAIVQIRDNVKT